LPARAIFSSVASVEADYENGVLRPVKPLRLRPGERVHIIVRRQSDPARWDLNRLAKVGSEDDLDLASAGLEDWARSLKDEDDR
jgi:predicted DNA-binding antitoxin AbrB/MazE fold protein